MSVETRRVGDYVCSRIAVGIGEVSAAEEWMAASVVGSAVRYLSVAGGERGIAVGGRWRSGTKEEE